MHSLAPRSVSTTVHCVCVSDAGEEAREISWGTEKAEEGEGEGEGEGERKREREREQVGVGKRENAPPHTHTRARAHTHTHTHTNTGVNGQLGVGDRAERMTPTVVARQAFGGSKVAMIAANSEKSHLQCS